MKKKKKCEGDIHISDPSLNEKKEKKKVLILFHLIHNQSCNSFFGIGVASFTFFPKCN